VSYFPSSDFLKLAADGSTSCTEDWTCRFFILSKERSSRLSLDTGSTLRFWWKSSIGIEDDLLCLKVLAYESGVGISILL
jgi:hypothetical protein